MRKLTLNLEEHNAGAIALELEQIASLISQDWTESEGWKLEGEDEPEPKIAGVDFSESLEELDKLSIRKHDND